MSSEGPQLVEPKAQPEFSVLRASMSPRLPASPLANSNSENVSSSPSVKSLPISNFHFSNSESGKDSPPDGESRPKELSSQRTLPRSSNLERVTSRLEKLPGTPYRVETRVAYRKQTIACCPTRHTSRRVGCSFHPRATSRQHPCISLLPWDITTPPDSKSETQSSAGASKCPSASIFGIGWGKTA